MDKVVVGIDVSKAKLDVVLRQGEWSRHTSFKNNPAGYSQLQQWIGQRGPAPVHVCLEATGQYGEAVAEYLYQQGHTVSVVNPARIKAYGQSQLRRNKTDKLDADLIADFCARQNPRPWQPLPAEVRKLQGLMRRLEDLKAMRDQERNRLKAGSLEAWEQADLQGHLKELKQRITDLQKAIRNHTDQHPTLQQQRDLLVSIQGIGEQTAYLLLSEIPQLSRFEHVNELVAFCGLNPRQHRSGSSIHGRPRLSKQGSHRLRKGLYFPAIVAWQHNPLLKTFGDRLLKAGKTKLCVIGALMRKLLHLVYGILKSGRPFDPHYRPSLPATS